MAFVVSFYLHSSSADVSWTVNGGFLVLSTKTGIRPTRCKLSVNAKRVAVKPAVRIKSQEPFLLLVIGKDIDKRGSPLSAIDVLELLEQDLNGLAVGGVHGEEVNALGILWLAVSIASVCNDETKRTLTSEGVSLM